MSSCSTPPLIHFAIVSNQGTEGVAVARESYDQFHERIAGFLDQEPPTSGQWLNINLQYAEDFIRQYSLSSLFFQ